MLSLKRAMTEQERVHKQFELKVNHLSDLLTKEMDKSQLLENQLAENLKKVRMLTTGTTTLDHLLTIDQCPSSSWGLGFQGSTSKSAEETVMEISNGDFGASRDGLEAKLVILEEETQRLSVPAAFWPIEKPLQALEKQRQSVAAALCSGVLEPLETLER
ncbi:hypothetical protein F2Q69_00012021 [Brassica cretica]|uniref:Uncharacterized protein n=1 Tax=Brassica cretica TaxID=69181 RepID=A0A8S9R0K0_BRACR|nr:hypothetical protein F2Q69_00012021 [Brassica cretica]